MAPPLTGPLSRHDARLDGGPARPSAWGDGLLRALTLAASAAVVVCVGAVCVYLVLAMLGRGADASSTFSVSWSPALGRHGLLPLAFGTVAAALLGLLLSAPIGILAAIWIIEVAPPRLSGPARTLVDVLATLPGVLFGVWGRSVVVPFVRGELAPLFSSEPSAGFGAVSAGIVLAAMILPTITSLACGALAAVPPSLRETAVALGGERWDVIRHAVLPVARAGLWGSVAIGLGRALGESIAVEMVCGSSPLWPESAFSPFSTLGAVLVDETIDATRVDHIGALAAAALWLSALSIPALLVGRRLQRRANPGLDHRDAPA